MFKKTVLVITLLFLCSCRETIIHNLSEPEANRIVAHLYDQKLSVKKEKQADGRWSLSLPESQVAEGIRSLDAHRLLKDEPHLVNDSNSFLGSSENERFKFERALSREIEATLSALPKVLQARVHLNLPHTDPLFGLKSDNAEGSASVMLISGSSDLDKADITALVAGASGIKPEKISVVVSLSVMPQETLAEKIPEIIEPEVSRPAVSLNLMQLVKSLPLLPVLMLGVTIIFILVLRQLNKRPKLIA